MLTGAIDGTCTEARSAGPVFDTDGQQFSSTLERISGAAIARNEDGRITAPQWTEAAVGIEHPLPGDQMDEVDDQAQAKLVVDQSLALQRRAGKIQRVAIAALLVFTVLWLWLIWR